MLVSIIKLYYSKHIFSTITLYFLKYHLNNSFAILKHLGLTIGQPKVLDYLHEHNGAIQKDIAGGCYIEPASLSNILNGMEKNGLIIRKISDENRRNMNIFMTEKGRNICCAIQKEIENVQKKALRGMSDDEIKHLYEYLIKINKNLEDTNE